MLSPDQQEQQRRDTVRLLQQRAQMARIARSGFEPLHERPGLKTALFAALQLGASQTMKFRQTATALIEPVAPQVPNCPPVRPSASTHTALPVDEKKAGNFVSLEMRIEKGHIEAGQTGRAGITEQFGFDSEGKTIASGAVAQNRTSGVESRRARSAVQPSRLSRYPSLEGDLPGDAGGLFDARVRAVKSLLGDQAIGLSDTVCMELGSYIHRYAHEHLEDSSAKDLSIRLWHEEMVIWAEAQGGNEVQVSDDAKWSVFRETRSVARNLLGPPRFKNQTELARIYIKENRLGEINDPDIKALQLIEDPQLGLVPLSRGVVLSDNELVRLVSASRDIKIQFFKQHDDYIRSHLDNFVNAKLLSNLLDAQIGRLHVEHRPINAWAIKDVRVKWHDGAYRNYLPHALGPSPREPAMLVQMPSNRYLLIGPDGSLTYVNDAIKDGTIQKEAILKALGISFSSDGAATRGAPALKDMDLRAEYVRNAPNRVFTVRDIIQGKIARHTLSLIDAWAKNTYDPGFGEQLLDFVVPFYGEINRSRLDKRYKVNKWAIAMDAVSVLLTLIPIGATVFNPRTIRSAIHAVRAAGIATGTKRALAIIGAVIKKSSISKVALEEVVDLFVPLLTMRQIGQAIARMPKLVAASKLVRMLAKMNDEAMSRIVQKARKAAFTVNDAQSFIDAIPASRFVDAKNGFVYKGIVFRGDMRNPEAVFRSGFELRQQVVDLPEVNGFRGGFGGGKNALDVDGKGISTSPYLKTDGAGADFYGRDRGGYTYVIDARELAGYDLYRNDHFSKSYRTYQQRHMSDALERAREEAAHAYPRPLEVNYGTDIPSANILGAFDQSGRYIPNMSAARHLASQRVKPIATRLRTPGDWNNDFGDFAPLATANALRRRIIIHGHSAQAEPLEVLPRIAADAESGAPVHVIYRPTPQREHYDALIDGIKYEIPEDGDCFFRAVLTGIRVDSSDIPFQAIRNLRENAAREVLTHPLDYEPFIARNDG
jgi:hypothetical protein